MSEKRKAASLFSGVGGLDLGFERAGWQVVAQCEFDKFRRQVLRRHWPDTYLATDVREVAGERGKVDAVFGGFPCQDLSVAGKRAGMREGTRSGLFFEFARIADESLDEGGWIVIENVPGLFSSHGGEDFEVLLRTLADLGFHDLAWRVLDSRHFGVPQRRRRVFVVARRARGDLARKVLLEPAGGVGDHAPRRAPWKDAAARAGRRTQAPGSAARAGDGVIASALDRMAGGADDNDAQANHIIPGHAYGVSAANPDVAGTLGTKGKGGGGLGIDREGAFVTGDESPTLRTNWRNNSNPTTEAQMLVDDRQAVGVLGDQPHTLTSEGMDASEDGTGRGTPIIACGDEAATLTSGGHSPGTNPPGRRKEDDENVVAFNLRGREGGSQAEVDPDTLANIRASAGGSSRTYVARVDSDDDASEAVTAKWRKGSGGPSGDECGNLVDGRAAGFNWQSGGDVRLQVKEGEAPTLQTQQVPAAFVEPLLYNPYRTSLGRGEGYVEGWKEDVIHDALTAQNPPKGRPVVVDAVGVAQNQRGEVVETEYSHQLTTGGGKPGEGYAAARITQGERNYVRRLTPTECERLQGFPDGWTLLDGPSLVDVLAWHEDPEYRHVWGWEADDPKGQDGRRYAAMGDAVTVPVARWIASRLLERGFPS